MGKQIDLYDLIEEITKAETYNKSSALEKKDWDLLEFKRILNLPPPKQILETNKEFGNKFIPLEMVEAMLLAIFDTYEVIIPFAPTLMEGQIVTVVNLVVTNPITKQKQTYSGIGSVPLISADDKYHFNHRNLPSSKAYGILNASKEIGQIFRVSENDYKNVMKPYFKDKLESSIEISDADSESIKRLLAMIPRKRTKASLLKVKKSVEKLKNKELKELYNKKMLSFGL